MTGSTSPALDVALAYHEAWTSHDLEKAMSYIADDIVCDAPAGRLEGAADLHVPSERTGPPVGVRLVAVVVDVAAAIRGHERVARRFPGREPARSRHPALERRYAAGRGVAGYRVRRPSGGGQPHERHEEHGQL